MSTTITAFPITTTPISGLGAAVSPFVPAAADLFAAVQIANPAQAPGGSLIKYTWAQMMTSPVLTGAPTIAAGTAATAASPLAITQTWNNGAVTFPGLTFTITDTASVATSRFAEFFVGASSKFSVDKTGTVTHAGNLATAGNAAIAGLLNVVGNTTVTQITASTKLAASTSGVTNGVAVADATTSAAISFAPKGLAIKGYVGSEKAGTLVSGSADGDVIMMATTGNIILSTSGGAKNVRIDTTGNVQNFASGFISYVPTGTGIGYGSGAGGAVTQISTSGTAVTLNTLSGQITTVTQSLSIGAIAAFTVNNSTVGADDIPVVVLKSGNTVPTTTVRCRAVAAGSFVVEIVSGANTESGALVIQYSILKSVKA